jgi:Flp pilus assembly CpaF family ATPase
MMSKATVSDRLINSALRGLPDRIIIGELRQSEASGYINAANTGHPGSITTIHANSAKDGVYRLEAMAHGHEKKAIYKQFEIRLNV